MPSFLRLNVSRWNEPANSSSRWNAPANSWVLMQILHMNYNCEAHGDSRQITSLGLCSLYWTSTFHIYSLCMYKRLLVCIDLIHLFNSQPGNWSITPTPVYFPSRNQSPSPDRPTISARWRNSFRPDSITRRICCQLCRKIGATDGSQQQKMVDNAFYFCEWYRCCLFNQPTNYKTVHPNSANQFIRFGRNIILI